MFQRRDYSTNELITVGFKANGKLAAAVHAAAEKMGHKSTSTYLKALISEWVAAELGVPLASFDDAPAPTVAPTVAQNEAAVAVARLEATIADAQRALEDLRSKAAPRRASGAYRRVG